MDVKIVDDEPLHALVVGDSRDGTLLGRGNRFVERADQEAVLAYARSRAPASLVPHYEALAK